MFQKMYIICMPFGTNYPGTITLVEREASVRPLVPVQLWSRGLRPFVDVAQNGCGRRPPLVPIGKTNRDKKVASQRLFLAMIDAGF